MLPLISPPTTRAPELRLDDLLPLTPAQTGMLFETLGSGDPSMYFEQVRFDLVGPLDLDRFRAAWEIMHARHSMLRTVFLWDGLDDPLQAVLSEVELDWHVVEPSELSPVEVAEGRAVRRRAEGIDLGRGAISTFDLIPIDEQRTHVIWSFHHLLLDGWSTARVVGDVLDLYETGRADALGDAAPETVDGSDFRPYLEWLADRDSAETTEFWRSLLAGVTEPSLLADLRGRTTTRSGRGGIDDDLDAERRGAALHGDSPPPSAKQPGSACPVGAREGSFVASPRTSFARGRIDVALTGGDSDRVRAAAAASRVTVNTMVQGAWARTLARYTGRTDAVFGVTVSGRPPELDGANETVGMFLNTLPFPVSVPGESSGAGWLQGLQRQQLDVSHHGHASLAEVQRLAPTANASAALFDSILVFENYPMRSAGRDAGVRVEHYGVFEQSHYPLTIMAGDMPDGGALGFIVVSDESVLAPWFARQLVDDFACELVELARSLTTGPAAGAVDTVAGAAVGEPPSRPSDAVSVGDEELSATISATVDHSTVTAAFAHRAQANANDLALRCGDESLTFAQLDARSALVAGELRRRGVGPEVPVGIAIERSINMVIAVLGVVKAGGCYLALDPSHPIERTSGILADAGAPIVLVDDDAAHRAIAAAFDAQRAGPGANGSGHNGTAHSLATIDRTEPAVLDVRSLSGIAAPPDHTAEPGDQAESDHAAQPDHTAEPDIAAATEATAVELNAPAITAESTLFLTFTSGSTGRPKGVPVHHRGVLRRLAWQYLTYPPTADEVGIAKTTLGFVDHLTELWGPLLAGQPVVLAPDSVVKDAAAFIDLCARERIRRLVVVPSYLEALLDAVPDLARQLGHLRFLTASGEPLAPALAHRVATAFARATDELTLLNIYGMSEATADVTAEAFTIAELSALDPSGPVPAGRPLPGLRVAITSENGRPLPYGVVGSIDVAGAALTNGYWRRPDLTSERFTERFMQPESPGADPDGGVERWYRTGDLGWLDPSGRLHVVGRSDHQVKVRGMRVELGEIEAAFERHPSVARCVAVLRDGTDIVVFVVPAATVPPPRGAIPSEAIASGAIASGVIASGAIANSAIAGESAPKTASSRHQSPTGGRPSGEELRAHAASLLPGYMLPAAIAVVEQLPSTPSGKLDRNELVRRSSDRSTFADTFTGADTAPGRALPAARHSGVTSADTSTELAAMLGLWRQVLPHAELGADTDFFDAGGHSLLALRLLTRINAAFETELSLAQVLQAPTPRSLTQLVVGPTASGTNAAGTNAASATDSRVFEYLVPIVSSPAGPDVTGSGAGGVGAAGTTDRRPTIFCVHGAGGNVLNFRALAKVIEPAFDMIGIQARGVDGLALPHSSMGAVVADYLPAVRAHQPSGPYLLAGYSGGGTIAVELARALEAEGETVEATLLLDTYHNDTRPRPFTREQHLEQLRRRGIGYLVEKVGDRLRPSESEDFEPLVDAALEAGRPVPLEAREWFIKGRMYELIGHHRIERYDGTVILFAATDTHPGLVHVGHDHGLGEVFPNLEIIDVEGDHQSLVEGHNAPELGRLLLDRLGADADGVGPSGGVGGALDAHQHVYRHLPSGLDESPLLARFVKPGTTVLDVGTAATGRSALALEALGANVVSIEINHRATREFAASDEFASSAIKLSTADMARLPFADASFDTVLVAFHGFDYLVDPAVRTQAIADLARVLRPGGHLVFNSFNTLGILATPTGARSIASWKRRLRFVRSGELHNRRLIDDNGLGLHHGRPGQIISEVERSSPLRFETITTLSGNKRHRLVVSALAPEPNFVFTKP